MGDFQAMGRPQPWHWLLGLALLLPTAPAIAQAMPAPRPHRPAHQSEVAIGATPASAQDPLQADPLQAIVQLEDLKLREPQAQGDALLTLEPLETKSLLRVVSVSIAGKAHRFLLDTGASHTMVSSELVTPLGLKGEMIPQSRLAVAGSNCPEPKMQVFSLPPLVLQTSLVKHLQGLQIEQALIPPQVSGLLGMDVLRQYDLQISPNQLALQPKAPASTPTPTAGAIALKLKAGVLLGEVMLNGEGPFVMLLDTGAGSTFISSQVAEQIQVGPTTPIKLVGFCGEEAAKIGHLSRVKLGDQEQKHLEVVVTDSAVIKALEIDGVLGQNFLNHYRQHWQLGSQNWLTLSPLE